MRALGIKPPYITVGCAILIVLGLGLVAAGAITIANVFASTFLLAVVGLLNWRRMRDGSRDN